MSLIFARGPLTDAVFDYLEDELSGDLLVGDGIAPRDGGWAGGQPGEGAFRPYVVIGTLTAQVKLEDVDTLGSRSWEAAYSFRCVGALRQQCDWAADKVRFAMIKYKPVNIDLGGDWRVLRTAYNTLGPVSRNDQTDPPYWEVTDTATLWLEAHG